LPGREDGYPLDPKTGEETIYVVAAASAIPNDAVQEILLSTQPAEQGNIRERPPELTDKNRGETPFYVAKPLQPGISGLRFTFQHQK
jgi:hypothetical protein